MGKRENDVVMRKIADMMVETAKIEGKVAGASTEDMVEYVAVNVRSVYNEAWRKYTSGEDMEKWIIEGKRLFVEMAVCLNRMREKVAGAEALEGMFNTLVFWAKNGVDGLSGDHYRKGGLMKWVEEEWEKVSDVEKEECEEVLRGD